MTSDAFPSSESNEPSDSFGLLDVVEAFTAMRQDWKTQVRESRVLLEAVQQALGRIDELSRSGQGVALGGRSEGAANESRALAEALAETDFTVERAVSTAERALSADRGERGAPAFDNSEQRAPAADTLLREMERRFAQLGWFRRWLAGAWHRELCDWLQAEAAAGEPAPAPQGDPLLEGLLMLRERVRRLLNDCGIERLDMEGLPFDPDWMHALDAVASPGVPPGQVVEQLRPAYAWNGKRIKYADVRVAR